MEGVVIDIENQIRPRRVDKGRRQGTFQGIDIDPQGADVRHRLKRRRWQAAREVIARDVEGFHVGAGGQRVTDGSR